MGSRSVIEEIRADLYRIEIPLPDNLLKFINSYVIKSSDRNLVIDTGMNREACMNAMQASLKRLGINLRETDFLITHFHIDHFGLVSSLITDNSILYFNKPESYILDKITSGIFLSDMLNFTKISGFPEDEIQVVFQLRPGDEYDLKEPFPFRFLEDGDTINIGDYQFQCVKTPGHSIGHLCLYEANKKIFVSGDHILNEITPAVGSRSDEGNPLKEYLASLEKVYPLDIELVLPGHKGLFRNCKERIKELEEHHQKRADEIISILEGRSQNIYQVASQMSWNITYDSWDLFPGLQKWFAVAEAMAHLKYLEGKGVVRKEMNEHKIIFSLHD